MSQIILYTIITLSAIGTVAAIILYAVAQKFKVFEDPKIDDVEEVLPAANCGGCGFPGCRGFAEACVKAEHLEDLFCPVGGNDTMREVAHVLGKDAVVKDPMIAVVRCAGACDVRPKTSEYDSAPNCSIAVSMYQGDTGCAYGCLGLGDCVDVCNFDAIHMDPDTGLPVVDEEKCTGCGACVIACPKDIIELRKKGKRGRRVYVSCVNQDKGGVAKKNCAVACIACKRCFKVCDKFNAITVENFCAYVDDDKCRLCGKCIAVCPTGAMVGTNFPAKRKKEEMPCGSQCDCNNPENQTQA